MEMEEKLFESINMAVGIINNSYKKCGKLLVCGNGGSSADADHIVGELMKGFKKKRPIKREIAERIGEYDQKNKIEEHLQMGLPAINLSAHTALVTAILNDIGGDMIFAQQVMGYGRENDVLLGISTSGNSKNVINALIVAKALGLSTIGMTGNKNGEMSNLCDITITVPYGETAEIQEAHMCAYHLLCEKIEEEFFGDE